MSIAFMLFDLQDFFNTRSAEKHDFCTLPLSPSEDIFEPVRISADETSDHQDNSGNGKSQQQQLWADPDEDAAVVGLWR